MTAAHPGKACDTHLRSGDMKPRPKPVCKANRKGHTGPSRASGKDGVPGRIQGQESGQLSWARSWLDPVRRWKMVILKAARNSGQAVPRTSWSAPGAGLEACGTAGRETCATDPPNGRERPASQGASPFKRMPAACQRCGNEATGVRAKCPRGHQGLRKRKYTASSKGETITYTCVSSEG